MHRLRVVWLQYRVYVFHTRDCCFEHTAVGMSYTLAMYTPRHSSVFIFRDLMGNPAALNIVLSYIQDHFPNDYDATNQLIRMSKEAVLLRHTRTLAVLYEYKYYLSQNNAEMYFLRAHSDMAEILFTGIIRGNDRKYRDAVQHHRMYRPSSPPPISASVSSNIIENIIQRGMTSCVSTLVSESNCKVDHINLLRYAVGHSRLDYVRQVLSRGIVSVNDNPQIMYNAIKGGRVEIVSLFIDLNVVYDENRAYTYLTKCHGPQNALIRDILNKNKK